MIEKECPICKSEVIVLSETVSICKQCKELKYNGNLEQFIKESYHKTALIIENNNATLTHMFSKSVFPDEDSIEKFIIDFWAYGNFMKKNEYNLNLIPKEILYEYFIAVYEIEKYEREINL